MFKSFKALSLTFGCLAAAALFSGCNLDESDVAAARDKVEEEQKETNEARKEADREINEKEKELETARHKAMRPNYDGDQSEVEERKEELEETRKAQNENIKEEERETQEAKADADRLESELAAKKSRDEYVAGIESKLEAVDQGVAAMKEKAESLEGAALQAAETDIELLKVKRDNLSDALSNLKGAAVTEWESQKENVKQALSRFSNVNGSDDQ